MALRRVLRPALGSVLGHPLHRARPSGGGMAGPQGGGGPEVRRNLLTYSEDFTNAAWSAYGGASVVSNDATAPDLTLTGDRIVIANSGGLYYTTYETTGRAPSGPLGTSIYMRRVSSGMVFMMNPADPGRGEWAINLSLVSDTEFERLTPAHPAVDVNLSYSSLGEVGLYFTAQDGAEEFYLWGVQQEAGAEITDYQKVEDGTEFA